MLYKNSKNVLLRATISNSAADAGELLQARKNARGEWILTDARGKNWLLLDGILRNAFEIVSQDGTAPENRRNKRNTARLVKILKDKGWPEDEAARMVERIYEDYTPQGLSLDARARLVIPYEYAIQR